MAIALEGCCLRSLQELDKDDCKFCSQQWGRDQILFICLTIDHYISRRTASLEIEAPCQSISTNANGAFAIS